MTDERINNLNRAFVYLLLLCVSAGASYIVTRLYAPAFVLAQISPDDALVAALVVVGAVVIALMLPKSVATIVMLIGASLSVAAGIAGAAALPLGLIDHAPLFWRGLLLGAVSVPMPLIPLLFWAMKPSPKVTESQRRLPKIDRKSLTFDRKQKRLSERKSPKVLANPASESAEDVALLLETLTAYIDSKGNMAATARALGMTPPGVGDRLRRLYEIEPERVTRDAPEWVKRNIKDEQI